MPMVRKEGEGMSDVEEQRKYYERMIDEVSAEYRRRIADLQAEIAELRKELAVTNPLFETLNSANDRLIYENMKLRELVRDMYDNYRAGWNEEIEGELYDRMRELGVEV